LNGSFVLKKNQHLSKKNTLKTIVLEPLLIPLLSTFIICIPLFLPSLLIIEEFTQAIPVQLIIFMFFIPILIYFGLVTKRSSEKKSIVYLKNLTKELKESSNINFKAYYFPTIDGSNWHFLNTSPLPIKDAIFIIERIYDKEVEVEKHTFKNLKPGEEKVIQSSLSSPMGAQWRAMLLSQKGVRIDYPSIWFKEFQKF
jgi:hypothetical protein